MFCFRNYMTRAFFIALGIPPTRLTTKPSLTTSSLFFLRRAALRAVVNVSSHLSRIGSPSMGCQKRKKSQVLLVNSNKLRGFFIRENKQHALISKGLDLFVSFYSILTSSTWFCEKFMGFIEDKMLLIDPITFSLDFWEIRGLI